MIVLNNEIVIDNQETLDLVINEFYNYIYNDLTTETFEILKQYLQECFEADLRLMEMTQEKLGTDICPVVFIGLSEVDDLNAFNFSLMSEDENREIKFFEEKMYYEFCDICFGQIQGLYDRIFLHFNE